MKFLNKLKSVDFYKKLPRFLPSSIFERSRLLLLSDLCEATLTGAWISISAAVLIAVLFGLDCGFSFPALSCEFATVDVSDALGTKKINLTKTVRKTPIDFDLNKVGITHEDQRKPHPKYDDWEAYDEDDVDVVMPINTKNFNDVINHYPIVLVNFYAPWCPWCQRLEPSWDAAAKEVHEKYSEADGRIRLAKVDCTIDQDLCRKHQIAGFPSIRVYRKGKDDIYVQSHHGHESYVGDRTKEAIVKFADSLIPSAGMPHVYHPDTQKLSAHAGCNLAGFVLVKKVPGTIHFLAKSPGTSFDHTWMNMTHYIHHYYFGTRPSPYRYNFLKRMHPLGLDQNWADKLQGEEFISTSIQSTHEHYIQVVLTTIEAGSGSTYTDYNSYEYTVHHHTYSSDSIPSAKFSYHLSPIQIVVREFPREIYKFVTSLCAIIGGVFTVAGILDSIVHQGVQISKKINLGKQI